MTKQYEMRSGAEILEALDKGSRQVEATAAELSRLTQDFHEAKVDEATGEIVFGVGLQLERAIDAELVEIYEKAVTAGNRPPAEDIRKAMARRLVEKQYPQLWVEYHGMKARIEALSSWISNAKAAINANQSIRKGEVP